MGVDDSLSSPSFGVVLREVHGEKDSRKLGPVADAAILPFR